MKTQLLSFFLALFFFSNILFSQCPGSPPAGYTCIPDSNFEQELINQGIDSEGGSTDGQVLTADINTVEILGVASQSISDLTGIEDFTALRRLVCNNNSIATLDLSSNMNLEALFCHFNSMISLTLPPTNTLYDLQCYQNSLTSLDVSNNAGLQVLWCYNNSIQNTLDASNCTILENFDCGFNQISSINMPDDSDTLWRFLCDNNNLSNLNVSNNLALTDIQCYNNPSLLSLDLTNNELLERIFCYNNTSMSSMLLPTTITLTDIDAFTTGLTSLDASGLTGLEYLRLNESFSLTSLTLPNTTTLQTFWMYGHDLPSIDFTPYNNLYTGLQYLDVGNSNLTSVDVSMLQNLIEFYCYDSDMLTFLNIANGNNANLDWMFANFNSNLTCIQVDDKNDADNKDTNQWRKDNSASYEESCPPPLSTDKFELSSVLIYPNPTKNVFEIDLNIDVDYKLHSIQGQEVLSGSFAQGLNKLDVSSISSGIYILNLNSDLGSISKKLVKH